ncbi:MAG: hypothetical protein AAGH99_07845 [Planctomycetota bacterium]
MTNTQHREQRNRGVASFFAVAALGLIATAILAMTVMLKIDHRRTQSSSVDAQLRQLLLAGAAAAEAQLESEKTPSQTGKLTLPEKLHGYGATVRWEPTDPELLPTDSEDLWITVIAEIAPAPVDSGGTKDSGGSAYQRLCFTPDEQASGYRIAAALISPK